MKVLGKLGSGERVIERLNPHDHEVEVSHFQEGFTKIFSDGRAFISQQIDFESVIGISTCVKVTDPERVFYGKRYTSKEKTKIRSGYSKFTYESPTSTSSLAIILLLAKEIVEQPTYILISCWYGPLAPPEPWDLRATAQSRPFWDIHALTYKGNDWALVKGTKTKNCPW